MSHHVLEIFGNVAPTLPVSPNQEYSGEHVWYETMGEYPSHGSATVPIEEIELLASPKLREILWEQAEDNRAGSRRVNITRVNTDGSIARGMIVNRRPLDLPNVHE
jgi:hypothetical protein